MIFQFIDTLFNEKKVYDEAGISYPLHSGITREEGEFMVKVITENKCAKTAEIGCAYGVSSLYICAGISQFDGAFHTIIDPFQREWKNIGVMNLKRAGFEAFALIEELSEIALPRMLSEKKKYDFFFIDGWHTFDHVMVDFFYANRMLEKGGVIIFHDVDMPSIKKLMRYILNYPSYEFLGGVDYPPEQVSYKRKLFNSLIISPFKALSGYVPTKNVYELFSPKIISSDRKLGINATMIAIRKTKEDERDWRWFREF